MLHSARHRHRIVLMAFIVSWDNRDLPSGDKDCTRADESGFQTPSVAIDG